ncbi:MAG: CMGC/CDK protein kinase [Amphiamblys sp. WSBS2006]|nr:MAG: CMGC/CDK protein kinase [Amphiamblys sp. WSBS2006]
MAEKYPKHPVLFFLSASAIVGAIGGYKEDDYENHGYIGSGCYGTVYRVREKKTNKIYALKTFVPGQEECEHAEREISTLRQLKHENIVRMVASSDIENRCEEDPVHIVLEHMPCDLNAALGHPETKKNRREILYRILKGVAYIHSKRLAHRDLTVKNILIDLTKLSVKICDFGKCRYGGRECSFYGNSMDGYYSDVLSIVDLMGYFYLGRSFSERVSLRRISRDEMERFVQTRREGGVLPRSGLGMIYREMGGVISEDGLDLFLRVLSAKNIGGYTSVAEALKHPFFDGCENTDDCRYGGDVF